MDKLILVKPSIKYKDQIQYFIDNYGDLSEGIDGSSRLVEMVSVEKWLEWIDLVSDKKNNISPYVTASVFLCIREQDNKLIGFIDIRHELNDYLRNYGGHIGYSVARDERRKGYGKEQLRLAKEEAKKIGINKLLITCFKDNIGSKKIIESAGGVLTKEVLNPTDGKIYLYHWLEF